MESPGRLRVLLLEPIATAIARELERSQPGLAVLRATRRDEALALLARHPTDALLIDVAALSPCEPGQLQELTDAARDAAVVALADRLEPDPQRWIEAGVHETVPRECVLAPCGTGMQLLRRALLYAWAHKQAEARLADLALRDELTGLPNRRAFDGLLAGAFARARRRGSLLGLLFLDLDGFKPVNDRRGHAAGDRVLREVAARVRAGLRESDLVARLGGDEFVVALEDLRSPRDAQTVADQLRLAIARPIDVGGDAVRCTASVGIAFAPGGRGQPGALLAAADAAMFERKRSQRPARAAAAEGDRQA